MLGTLSKGVGQNASAPSLFDNLLTGSPTFCNQTLPLAFVFSHVEDLEDC